MSRIIREARERGHSERTDKAYFVRDRGLEWKFERLPDGTVVGHTTFNPDGCPAVPSTDYYIVPPDAPLDEVDRGINSLWRFHVSDEAYQEFMAGLGQPA
jgi:hypothetical protein